MGLKKMKYIWLMLFCLLISLGKYWSKNALFLFGTGGKIIINKSKKMTWAH